MLSPNRKPNKSEKNKTPTNQTPSPKVEVFIRDVLGIGQPIVEQKPKPDTALQKIELLSKIDPKKSGFSTAEIAAFQKQLIGIHTSFLSYKNCMDIPHKGEDGQEGERERLEKKEELTAGEALRIKFILQDKIVLHHVQYIVDIDELVKMIQHVKHPREIDKFKRIFDNKIKYLLNEFHHKELYLKIKKETINSENPDFGKIEDAFKAYCKNCSYYIHANIPKQFQSDSELQSLIIEDAELSAELNDNLDTYFQGRLCTERRLRPKSFIGYKKEDTGFLGLLTKGAVTLADEWQKLKQDISHAKHVLVAIDRNLDSVGQKLVGEDTGRKSTFVAIQKRIEELELSEDECHAKKVELENLRANISEFKVDFNIQKALKDSLDILSSYNKSERKGSKNLKEFYDLEKQKFEHEISKLTEFKKDLEILQQKRNELRAEKQRQNQLIELINKIKRDEGLPTDNIGIMDIREQFSAVKKKIKSLVKASNDNNKDIKILLKEHDEILKNNQEETKKLEVISQRFRVYEESIKKLRDKTLSVKQIDDRFAHIKRQAQLYWGQAMQVRFESEASAAAEIAGYLADDHENMMADLEQSELTNSSYIKDLISNVGEVLKDSIEDVLFNIWQSEEKIDNPKKARKHFLKELKLLGFNNDEYAKLVDGARRLLVLRDCLLLNKKINSDAEAGLRAQFIIDHDLQNKKKQEIDAAIHLYFMQQLQPLINQSFTKIYNLHEKDIKANSNISAQMKDSFIRFLKKLTNSEQQYSEFRQICSVQMQIGFLKGMAKYLENMRDMPSIKARRFVRLTRASFIGGAIGLSVGLAAGFISFGTIPLVMIGCCVIGAIASSVLMRFDYFKYLRSANDRKLLTSNIQILKREAKRLKTIAKDIVSTDLTHQTTLKKFEGVDYSNSLNPFKAIASIFKRDEMKTSKVLIGSADALMREYSDRYRHSVFIEVDFQKTIKPLILRAAKQTQALQEELLAYSAQNSFPLTLLNAYITNTRNFLGAEEGTPDGELRAAMESLFNIREKLREQILEIVSALSVKNKIPDELLNFYVNDLRGSESDLKLSRCLNSLDAVRVAAGEMKEEKSVDDEKHSNPGVSLRTKMESQKLPIFAGSDRYRTKMGDQNDSDWGRAVDGLVCADDVKADPINVENIEKYLEQSRAFLLSLDARNENLLAPTTLNGVYEHSLQYIIYRAMFLKQLAEMVDPTDENYKPLLSKKILSFAENKLLIADPKKLFKEIQQQDNLLPNENKNSLNASPHQEEKNSNKTYKGSIVDAIRVSITYDTKPTTAFDLMIQYLGASSIQENANLFGINPNILEKLGVPKSQRSLNPLLQTISNTEKLFHKILTNSSLTNYKVHEVYFKAAMQQIIPLEEKLSLNLKREFPPESQEKKNLTAAYEAIKLHRIKLDLLMKLQNDQYAYSNEKIENDSPTMHFVSPAAHALFQPKSVSVDLKEETQEKLVKSALLKALSAYAGDKNSPIQFNLGWLVGDDKWKIKYRNLLEPFLSEKDKNLFPKVTDKIALGNAM